MRVLCSSRKPMRKTPVLGFPRALLSLSHARKRRALASRLKNEGNNSSIPGSTRLFFLRGEPQPRSCLSSRRGDFGGTALKNLIRVKNS